MSLTSVDSVARERPVLIEQLGNLRLRAAGSGRAYGAERQPVVPSMIWNTHYNIPGLPPAGLAPNGGAGEAGPVDIVRMFLTPVAGSTLKWEEAEDQPEDATTVGDDPLLSRVVPASFGDSLAGALAWAPTLTVAAAAPGAALAVGATIPFSGGTWVVDGVGHFVEFPAGSPAGVTRLTLQFYRYTGPVGGTGGGDSTQTFRYATAGGRTVLGPNPDAPDVENGASFVVPLPAQSTEGAGTRFMFDGAKGALRAGLCDARDTEAAFDGNPDGTAWDDELRGIQSVAFGRNTTALGDASAVLGGVENRSEGDQSTVCGGRGNVAAGIFASVGGGNANLASGLFAAVGGGAGNTATGQGATVCGGSTNGATGQFSFVGGGGGHDATAMGATVVGGDTNVGHGNNSFIGAGENNTIGIPADEENPEAATASENSAIIAGAGNNVYGNHSAIVCGSVNLINQNVSNSSVLSGSGLTATQDDTAYAQRLAFTGGLQIGVSVITGSNITRELSLDEHFVLIHTASALELSMPATPSNGQAYIIRTAGTIGAITQANLISNGRPFQPISNAAGFDVIDLDAGQNSVINIVYVASVDRWILH